MDYDVIIYIIAIAVLFLLVQRNNKSNRNKLYNRKSRDFRTNFKAKREELKKKKEAENSDD